MRRICACAGLLTACAVANGQVSDDAVNRALGLPPGSTVVVESVTTRDGGTLRIEEEATGTGAALRASGEKIVSDFKGTAPGADLNNRTATGGDTSSVSKIIGGVNLASNPLLWVGLLLVLGAGGAFFMRLPIRACLIMAGVGIGLMAAAFFPGLLLFVAAGAIVAVAGPYLYNEWKLKHATAAVAEGEKSHEALRAVVAGVSDFKEAAKDPADLRVTPNAWTQLKKSIESHTDGTDTTVIDTVRAEDRLA